MGEDSTQGKRDLLRRKKQRIGSFCVTMSILVAIFVCFVCDHAITGTQTWSQIVISSLVFAWLISFPTVRFWKKGVVLMLISISVFLIPYLYILDQCISAHGMVFYIGHRIGFVSIICMWVFYLVCKVIYKNGNFIVGWVMLLILVIRFSVSYTLTKALGEHYIQSYDWISFIALAILAFFFFTLGFLMREKGE